jgi:hypothetical protein
MKCMEKDKATKISKKQIVCGEHERKPLPYNNPNDEDYEYEEGITRTSKRR